MKIDKFKHWIQSNPKRQALVYFFTFVLTFTFFRLFFDNEDFLASPLSSMFWIVAIGGLLAYIIFAVNTRKMLQQPIPDLISTPFFKPISLAIKIISALVILLCIFILVSFQIENWGGAPDLVEQLIFQLIGAIILIPLSLLYLKNTWKFEYDSGSFAICFLAALGLYFWIAFYAWRNPAISPPTFYEHILFFLTRSPFIPPAIMLIPWLLWIVMVKPEKSIKVS